MKVCIKSKIDPVVFSDNPSTTKGHKKAPTRATAFAVLCPVVRISVVSISGVCLREKLIR